MWARPVRRGGLWMAAALVSVRLCAQAPSLSASELAARVDRHYNSLQSLKARFSESYRGLGMNRSESGTLLLRKPGRMRWDYDTPAGKAFDLDGKYAWFYSPGDPQVQRLPAKELDDLRSPLRFLLGHTQLEKELENLTVAPAGDGSYKLTGQPRGENRIARLTLSVAADGTIRDLEMQEPDGAVTSFQFSDQQPNAPIPPQAFRFTPPAGIPIVAAPPPV